MTYEEQRRRIQTAKNQIENYVQCHPGPYAINELVDKLAKEDSLRKFGKSNLHYAIMSLLGNGRLTKDTKWRVSLHS